MDERHYFAYGSNMAAAVMNSRVAAEPVGRAVLRGYRLAFTLPSQNWGGHAADVLPDPDSEVWGRLWRLTSWQLAALDRVEAAYDRTEVTIERAGESAVAGAEPVVAFTYTVRRDRRAPTDGVPSQAYLERLLEGAVECGLPSSYVGLLAAAAEAARGRPASPAGKRLSRVEKDDTPRQPDRYDRFTAFLRGVRQESLLLGFGQIEEILCFPLPPSARRYLWFWESTGRSIMARAIRDAGWLVTRIDPLKGTVRLHLDQAEPPRLCAHCMDHAARRSLYCAQHQPSP